MQLAEILEELKSLSNKKNIEGMGRFGINNTKALGINIPVLRTLAKHIGKNNELAFELWSTEIHEARLLAIFITDVKKLTEEQLESWLQDFDSWDVCDQACSIFTKHPLAYKKAIEWTSRQEEFQKRAGFSLIASLAVHDKKADDMQLIQFLPIIERESYDDRNFVKKAINWALRQIGKRNSSLMQLATEAAKRIYDQGTPAAKWIASDALREFKKKTV